MKLRRTESLPEQTAKSHVFVREPVIPAETLILGESLTEGRRVLDVGCAATGRSARLARGCGASVCSIDVNLDSIRRFRSRRDSQDIELINASGVQLPFRNRGFDMVLWALQGLDYLDDADRVTALRESERVLRPQGRLVFCTANPIGTIASPRALTKARYLRWRCEQLVRLGFLQKAMIDLNGLRLHQATPWKVIEFVREATDLEYLYAMNKRGRSKNLLLLTLFSAAPYYVFKKQDAESKKQRRGLSSSREAP